MDLQKNQIALHPQRTDNIQTKTVINKLKKGKTHEIRYIDYRIVGDGVSKSRTEAEGFEG